MSLELTIIARITRQGPLAPTPGVYFILSVYEYEVIEPAGQIGCGEQLDVGHGMAAVGDQGFTAGSVRRLRLTDQLPSQTTLLFSDDHPQPTKVWFCIESSPVEESAAPFVGKRR